MAKDKKVEKQVNKTIMKMHESGLLNQLSKEEIVEAIIESSERIEKNRKQKDEAAREKRVREWDERLGIKDFSNEKNWFRRKAFQGINSVTSSVKMLFLKKDDLTFEGQINIAFISMFLNAIFAFFKFSSYILACIFDLTPKS